MWHVLSTPRHSSVFCDHPGCDWSTVAPRGAAFKNMLAKFTRHEEDAHAAPEWTQ